jgi:hypothetical protein
MTLPTQQAPDDWFMHTKPAEGFETLNPEDSLGEGIGASYPIIGYKGKIWTIRYQGQSHILVRPDDGTPSGYIDVVILRSPPVKAKSYYPDGFSEDGSAGKRPTCSSLDGVKPDPDVVQKQADLCALCKHNEFYTDQNGRKTRDCSDYKRLAVLVMPNQTTRLFGAPLMEPAFLRVPPASLQKLLTFGENMAKQGHPYSSFVTRISFDPQKSHPEFVFKAVQGLSKEEAPVIIQMRNDTAAKRITGEDEIGRREQAALPPPGTANPGLTLAPAGQPVATLQGRDVALQGRPPVVGFTAPVTPPPKTIEMQNFGGAFSVAPPQEPNPNPQPGAMVGQTAADVGSAVEDPDLDRKIAEMLKTS